ncbi:MAG TPA: dihydrofolate reductase [Steroidobacteraceae bacterium]|nr:dihydrofolate reductase [Steroidobacteraceae bacterium]
MRLTIIAALADNNVIGRAGTLPWHLPDDLRRFKSLTMGRPILMGRRTFESIGRALPGRRNLVLTRSAQPFPPGVEPVASLRLALEECAKDSELCVIGGADIYRQTLPRADRLELTRVHAVVDGDVAFPEIDPGQWREVSRVEHPDDERHAYAMTFLTLERR